jgi:hypothetical protein
LSLTRMSRVLKFAPRKNPRLTHEQTIMLNMLKIC